MDKLRILGGRPLSGEITISGAKNAALPALFASLLTATPCRIARVPPLGDIKTALSLLGELGAEWNRDGDSVIVRAADIKRIRAPYDLVKTMRASVLALGPLLARFGRAEVSLPGGCAIGLRPIDWHINALSQMGADIKIEDGYIRARLLKGQLVGAKINLPSPTVTGTENLMAAATLADGETIIENAAREPEIVNLAEMLTAMGADIEGAGTSRIQIRGRRMLGENANEIHHKIIPDRIEAGTYLAAVAAVGGEAILHGADISHLRPVAEALEKSGAEIEGVENAIRIKMRNRPRAVSIETAPHPGFPTDMQAQMTAVNCVAVGESEITETIFENRFMHISELIRMGADISAGGRRAHVRGVAELNGAPVMATDLRASASLVIAGLMAKGETMVHRIYHLDRGYERMEEKLSLLSANAERIR